MFTYTLNANTPISANESQSNMEIDLEEHTVTSFTSYLSTDIVSRFLKLKYRLANIFLSFMM